MLIAERWLTSGGNLAFGRFACFYLAVCDLTPKARHAVFYESSESESARFGTPPALGYLHGPYCKSIARTHHGDLAVPGRQSRARTLARAQESGRGAKGSFF